MGREIRRTLAALRAEAIREASGESIPRIRAIVQIALTAVLLPLALYVVFGPRAFTPAARDAASALLGAIVTFWLKD
jgi:small-conductance mechanosensitive channel